MSLPVLLVWAWRRPRRLSSASVRVVVGFGFRRGCVPDPGSLREPVRRGRDVGAIAAWRRTPRRSRRARTPRSCSASSSSGSTRLRWRTSRPPVTRRRSSSPSVCSRPRSESRDCCPATETTWQLTSDGRADVALLIRSSTSGRRPCVSEWACCLRCGRVLRSWLARREGFGLACHESLSPGERRWRVRLARADDEDLRTLGRLSGRSAMSETLQWTAFVLRGPIIERCKTQLVA